MAGTQTREHPPLEQLFARIQDDPWSLTLAERARLAKSMDRAQREWAARLPDLVEPPAPRPDFPAWLLATEAFEALREAVASARTRTDLTTATADELQRFVDLYRDYPICVDPSSGEDPALGDV